MIYITNPAGDTDTFGPIKSYDDGTTWMTYIPDKVGNWTIEFSWAGDDSFTACTTGKQILTVQVVPISTWTSSPLPIDYWTYPINPENREWYQISGPWLGIGNGASQANYNAYSQAPASSHVLWKLSPSQGIAGQIGGQYGTTAWYGANASSIYDIIGGRGYYQADGMIRCIDTRTGMELWNTTGSYNQAVVSEEPIYWEGVPAANTTIPVLISLDTGNIIKYDALTGKVILDEPGILGMTHLIDYPYAYTFDGANLIKWTLYGSADDISQRIIWNVSSPFIMGYRIADNVIVSILPAEYGGSVGFNATTGDILWTSLDAPYLQENPNPTIDNGNIYYASENRHYAAVNIYTGNISWLSESAGYPWGGLWGYGRAAAYNMVYAPGYDGVYAFNQSNGNIVWHFTAGNSGFETTTGTWIFFPTPVVADGKVYIATGEHSIRTLPIDRGQRLFCLNASDGKAMWSIMGHYTTTAVAEGTLFATNSYDGCSYAFTKGQTATTILVSSDILSQGNSILIKGSVMDMSPAQPNTPAVSDASMSGWMEYLHMQQPMPTNTTGVSVTISVVDSNDNYRIIGTTTTDNTGNFNYLWTPDITGTYTLAATFTGSESYYSSSARTSFGVTEASATATPQPTPSPSMTDLYFLPMSIAIFIAVLIVGIAIILALRKQP
jgi:outer membrane protein assembly factor BamB